MVRECGLTSACDRSLSKAVVMLGMLSGQQRDSMSGKQTHAYTRESAGQPVSNAGGAFNTS